jgi:hypothetical protein
MDETKINCEINCEEILIKMKNYIDQLITINNNYDIINAIEIMTTETILQFKNRDYDISIINNVLCHDNCDILKYFVSKNFRFTSWSLYQCVINDSVLCFNFLKHGLVEQHYSDYFMEIAARSDSIKILSSIMLISSDGHDIDNLIDICEMMKSEKCLKYLTAAKKVLFF